MIENELYHTQRKGAKWGVHNGPPYPLDVKTIHKKYKGGKIFKSNEESDSENRKKFFRIGRKKSQNEDIKKEEKKESDTPKQKKLSEMSDDEIKNATARRKLENEYKREFGIKDIEDKAREKQKHDEKRRQDFIDKVKDELIIKPAVEVGSKWIKAALTDAVEKNTGLDIGGSISEKRRKEAEKRIRISLAGLSTEKIEEMNKREKAINEYVGYKVSKSSSKNSGDGGNDDKSGKKKKKKK